jgi:tetratricopeptide (TPR) repeat protein
MLNRKLGSMSQQLLKKMMVTRFRNVAYALAFVLAAPSLLAQQHSVARRNPHAKSPREADAFKKVRDDWTAGDWDRVLTDSKRFRNDFPKSEFEVVVLDMEMDAAGQKGDSPRAWALCKSAIKLDPDDAWAYALPAQETSFSIRSDYKGKQASFDRTVEYAHKALDLLKNDPTPRWGVSPAEWPPYKRAIEAQAHDALGVADDITGKYRQAIEEYQTSLNLSLNPSVMTNLALTYIHAKQFDSAIAVDDRILTMNDTSPSLRQYAQAQKDTATRLKALAN